MDYAVKSTTLTMIMKRKIFDIKMIGLMILVYILVMTTVYIIDHFRSFEDSVLSLLGIIIVFLIFNGSKKA